MRWTAEWRAWSAMRNRCLNPTNAAYTNYGGRGIAVCPDWERFETFFADMGPRPDGTSLDRIDNDKGYSADNCRWATRKQQSANRRNVRRVEANGSCLTLLEWSELSGIPPRTIAARLDKGWSAAGAVSVPVMRSRKGTRRGAHAFDEAWGAEHGVEFMDPQPA